MDPPSESDLGLRLAGDVAAFGTAIEDVFVRNHEEFMRLLDGTATDPHMAIAMSQSRHEDPLAAEVHALTNQRLHSYVAGTASLVDHSRRFFKKYPLSCADEWNRRKKQLVAHGEIGFVKDLRNFTVHRTLPVLVSGLTVDNPSSSQPIIKGHIGLQVEGLLEWDEWNSDCRRYIADQGEAVWLHPVTERHGALFLAANPP